MNILDLKRSLLPLQGYRMPSESDGGNGNEGTSGATDSASGRGSSGSGGFGMFGISDDTSLADNLTGYNAKTGFQTTQVSAPEDTNYGYVQSAANRDRTNVGINGTESSREKSLASKVVEYFDENPLARNLPFAKVVENVARATRSVGGEYTDSEIGAVTSALSDKSGGYNGGSYTTSTSTSPNWSSPSQTSAEATAAANKDPATLATSIANQSWNDWQGDKAALQTQVATNTQRGNALYDSATGAANGNMKLVSGMQDDYNNIYRPAGQQYANYVNSLGTDAYKAQQRGIAMANVQQQGDSAMQQQQRAMQRMGVNPSSGRFAAMGNQNAIGMAASKAQAGANSDRAVTQDWANGLTRMSDMGNNTLNSAKGLDSSAQSWNTLGLNAGSTGFNQGSDLSKLSGFNASTSGTVAGNAANAIYNQGQLANANAANSRANDAANPWTTIGGAVLTDYLKGLVK